MQPDLQTSELDIIKNSPFFDEEYYYRERPDVREAGVDAAWHYLCAGWKEGADPSLRFCTNMYLAHHQTERCPLLDYEAGGRKGDYSPRGALKNRILLYRLRRCLRRAKTACYTYVSEGYDRLISHRCISYDWDYICYTNDEELIKRKYIGIWQVRRALYTDDDSKRSSGWHKTHPEECCAGYRNSIWVDGNVNVLSPYLRRIIKKRNVPLLVPAHYVRDCIFDECAEVKRLKRDTDEKCDAAAAFLEREHMPRHYGMNENNIIYREHGNATVRNVDRLWWDCISKYSKRDQLSFSYCLWKNGIRPEEIAINNARTDYKNFIVGTHGENLSKQESCPDKNFVSGSELRDLLVYSWADEKYYPFAILYPLFVLVSNPEALVEIAVADYAVFYEKYKHLLEYYQDKYAGRVLFHQSDGLYEAQPGAMRFITQPLWKAKYVYIGDVDIFVCHGILEPHLDNIRKNGLDFSNIKRKGQERLSGLHFIAYDKMYPVGIPEHVNLKYINDEILLYKMMQAKGYKIPDENENTFRPLLGLHASYYSRPPLPSLTTADEDVACFPSWFVNTEGRKDADYAGDYLRQRYCPEIQEFMKNISPFDVELRKIIQFVDIVCRYYKQNYR